MPNESLPSGLREFTDYDALRDDIFGGVVDAANNRFPFENSRYQLSLSDLSYGGKDKFSLDEQRDAILKRRSLNRPLTGTWTLTDRATGAPVDTKRSIVMHVPYLTRRGTYILRGNEYTVGNQARLKAGVYSRIKQNGELESHFNIPQDAEWAVDDDLDFPDNVILLQTRPEVIAQQKKPADQVIDLMLSRFLGR